MFRCLMWCVALPLAAFAAAQTGGRPAAESCSVVFYSGRADNKDIYILHFEGYRAARDGSGPVRLTRDPAWDGWASFVPPAKR